MDTEGRRAPNIRDVARRAGVSYQTVSRVLNDSEALRPATRERVRAAIEELGYRPNPAARALVTSRSKTIGVISPQSGLYGPTTTIQATEVAAREAGYRLSITSIGANDAGAIGFAIDFLLGQSIDALVVLAPQRQVLDAIAALSITVPYVTLEATELDDGRGLSVDQVGGARLAVRHLVELGHRRILHISGPTDWIEAEARFDGYIAELIASRLDPLDRIVGDWTAESGYRIGLDVLLAADFSAVFCGNDQMALGLMHACRELNVRVPHDLSVVGFDDTPESAHFAPGLTTVRQDFAEIGRRAVSLLLSELRGDFGLEHESIAPALTVRDSTAPPNS
jgi:DNA-binding LacI/PurR family transcriptional regulator